MEQTIDFAKILDTLNENQHAAVTQIEGPMMVIAGAGSGKTRVLTFRIAHLIEQGVDAFDILALTFTNKAAKEMKERIVDLVGNNAKNLWMGTFHSVFAKILRTKAHLLGYPTNFTIYDTQDSKSVLKSVLDELGLDEKIYKISNVYGRISDMKNHLISSESYAKNSEYLEEDRRASKPRFHEVYSAYQKRCFRSGAMDFDDLLFQTNILLRDFPEVLAEYQEKFKFILVDEYQDTNFSQYLIVKKLAEKYKNLCVVGDDAQSIYGFRGANIENILNFKHDYPDYKLYKLEENYRSTQYIVQAANSVIAKNQNQIPKKVYTNNAEGDQIQVLKTGTDNEEGSAIAQSILQNKINLTLINADFAVLYRTNAQSRAIEENLRKRNIPYKIYGGLSFYQRKEIKDLLAYFRLAVRFEDEESLKRIINYPKRGIGETSLDKAILVANENNIPLWHVLENPRIYPLKWVENTYHKVEEFVIMIKAFHSALEKDDAYTLAMHIAQNSGILKELWADKTPEGIGKYDNIQELLNGIKDFVEISDAENHHLQDFLIDVALLTEADRETEEDRDKVSLMTIHNSKGLEFSVVYICGLEENLFPSALSMLSRAELEEERRLFYVALTRARKKVYLTYAQQRYKWGQLSFTEPSRFIGEIASECLDVPEKTSNNQGILRRGMRFSSFSAEKKTENPVIQKDISQFKVGMEVEHAHFGKGKILEIEVEKAMVFFPAVGKKQLLLKFAGLKILKDV